MQLDFEGISISFEEERYRRESSLDRMRRALDTLEQENQAMQAEVGEFQSSLVDLRAEFSDLADSFHDFDACLAAVRTDRLSKTVRKLGGIADRWLNNCNQMNLPLNDTVKKTAA